MTCITAGIAAGGLACALGLSSLAAAAQSAPAPRPGPEEFVRALDRNGDGGLDRSEMMALRAAVFARVDLDGDQRISLAELTASRDRMVEQTGRAPQVDLGKVFADLDSNRDGGITLEEFQNSASGRFTRLDANKDGKVTADELRGPRAAPPARTK